MATTISTQDLIDVKRDIDDIGKAVNEKVIVSPRYGEDFRSLPMISAEFQISSDAAEAAAVSAAESANISQSSANIAEAAATAATISAGVFETPEAGVDPVTGVADGAYFNVRSSSDESYIDEYQNVGGSAVATGKSYPSSRVVQEISAELIKYSKFKQPEIGSVEQDLSVRAKTQQYLTDYATAQNAFAVKRNNSTYLQIPNGQYNIDGVLPLNGSHLIEGQGDQTILKFAGAGNGIVYSAGSKFDDHAHHSLRDFRVQGDNTKAGLLDAKNGTTVGYQMVATGHFGETSGMTFEGHAVGQLVQQNYTSRESYNFYRANKVGLHLNGITSYRIESIYARHNSDAALLITGDIQNLTIDGGAIEGNRGRGIWAKDLSVVNTRASIEINDLYMEVDGDYAAGVPAVDIQEVDNMTIAVRGGVFWLNTASGITSGVYKWGRNVVFDGSSLAGQHYATNMSIINRGVVEVGRFNTCDSEAASRLHGLVEPVLMHKFEPREVRNALIGTPFIRGKPASVVPFSNIAAATYPFTSSYSAGIAVAEDTASDYGDGSFQSFTIPTTGNFNSNYVELTNYDSAVTPYHIFCFMLKPLQDMEIGFTQAGAQTQYSGYFKLKAGVAYKLVMTGNNATSAINRLRMYSLESTSKKVSFKPIIKATFKNRDDCIGFLNRHCLS